MSDNNLNNGYSFSSDVSSNEVNASQGNNSADNTDKASSGYANMFYANTPDNNGNNHKKKHSKAFLKVAGNAVAFGLIAAICFTGFNKVYRYFDNSESSESLSKQAVTTQSAGSDSGLNLDKPSDEEKLPNTTVTANGITKESSDVSDIVYAAMPSLVSISGEYTTTSSWFGYLYENTTKGSGSGIIIGKNDDELLIATNNHVVEDAKTLSVTFIDGTSADVTVKGTDSSSDLAVVSVKLSDLSDDTLKAISVATLGSSDDAKVGQMVIAIGNAMGYGQSVTVGYLSAKDREITESSESSNESTTINVLQVDAAINPGNSGGALLNVNGEVIGINCAKLEDTTVEGVGYAIPISDAVNILNDLMNREQLTDDEKGYLGIYMSSQEITSEISELYGWPEGVFVKEVVADSPAEKAGIKANDIITAVNGMNVTTNSGLQEKVNSYKAGTKITITVERSTDGEYKKKDIEVTLGTRTNTFGEDSTTPTPTPSADNSDGSDGSDSDGSNGYNYNPFGNSGDSSDPFSYFFGNGSSDGSNSADPFSSENPSDGSNSGSDSSDSGSGSSGSDGSSM
jgi:serine protease Do